MWFAGEAIILGLVRIVAHVDMDAFYAAVEAQRNPALRDRPLVVGADPKEGHGRGVVTAASYAARRYGIRSALPISRAWRLAEAARRRGEPETIFVRDDHALYREVSARIMAILATAGDAFQKTSVDEAYLELSSLGSFDAAVERARRLKADIVSKEGLTASVGIGPNKLVAKIASDFQKPDGLRVVRPEEVQPFLDPLRIRVIPGIGPKTERFLHERHIRTVADLRTLDLAQLAEWFGRWGEDLFAKARGLSESAVSNERERKSVGEQETFEVDTLDATFVLERARALARTVWSRLEGHGFRAFRTVTVTVRFENFITFASSRTGREVWTSEEALCAAALEPLVHAPEAIHSARIGGIGVVDHAALERERAQARPLARVRGHVGPGRGRELGDRSLAAGCFPDQRRLAPVVVFDRPLALLLLGEPDIEIGVEVAAERGRPGKRPPHPPLVRLQLRERRPRHRRKHDVVVGQVDGEAVESVGDRRAGRTPCFVVGPEHEVVDEELRAPSEKVGQRGAPLVRLESVLLVDPDPRQLLPSPRQLVAAPRELLLRLEQLEPRCEPLFTCPGHVLRHRSSLFPLSAPYRSPL